jgi:AcrR family transcriptional regulator
VHTFLDGRHQLKGLLLQESEQNQNLSYHHGNLHDALMAEGLKLIETTQGTEFSLRELTRSLGVTVNAAYRHFANKEDLLRAIAAQGFRELVTRQAEAIQSSSNPTMGFSQAGRAYITFAQAHPALFRLMFSRFAATNRSEDMNNAAQLAYDGMRYSLAAVLNKDVEDIQVVIGSAHAWSIVHGLSHLLIDGQFDRHTQHIDGLIDAVLNQAMASNFQG